LYPNERLPRYITWFNNLTRPAIWAVRFYRISHKCYLAGVPMLPDVIDCFSRILTGVEIHCQADIGVGFKIDHGVGTVVGRGVVIGDYCHLWQGVTIGTHDPRLVTKEPQHPVIGNGVHIFAGAKVLGTIRIGDGATIGANAVVLYDMPPGATAVSPPATIKPPRNK
jgi:serine O-acetyltransferase